MRLGNDQVATVVRRALAEDMVEANLHHGRSRGVGRYMTAYASARILSLQYHGHGIPAQYILDGLLEIDVTGIVRLSGDLNGIEIGGIELVFGKRNIPIATPFIQIV